MFTPREEAVATLLAPRVAALLEDAADLEAARLRAARAESEARSRARRRRARGAQRRRAHRRDGEGARGGRARRRPRARARVGARAPRETGRREARERRGDRQARGAARGGKAGGVLAGAVGLRVNCILTVKRCRWIQRKMRAGEKARGVRAGPLSRPLERLWYTNSIELDFAFAVVGRSSRWPGRTRRSPPLGVLLARRVEGTRRRRWRRRRRGLRTTRTARRAQRRGAAQAFRQQMEKKNLSEHDSTSTRVREYHGRPAMIGLAVAALAADCPPQWVPSPNASFRYACHFVTMAKTNSYSNSLRKCVEVWGVTAVCRRASTRSRSRTTCRRSRVTCST